MQKLLPSIMKHYWFFGLRMSRFICNPNLDQLTRIFFYIPLNTAITLLFSLRGSKEQQRHFSIGKLYNLLYFF